MIDITHDFQKLIFDKLEENTRELKRRINTRINDIKNMFKKESYTIVLNDTLQKTFKEPIDCKNCEIALVEFNIKKLFNINENSILEYKFSKSNKWNEAKIPPQCYDLKSLQNVFASQLFEGGPVVSSTEIWVTRLRTKPDGTVVETEKDKKKKVEEKLFHLEIIKNKIILKSKKDIKIRFSDSLARVLGFDSTKEYEAKDNSGIEITSENEVDLPFNNSINIHLNCIKNNFFNDQESSIVYSFFQNGCEVNERPNNLIYHPIKKK